MFAAFMVKIILAVFLSLGAQEANWGTVDGHKHCTAVLGDTSLVFCKDGYFTTS